MRTRLAIGVLLGVVTLLGLPACDTGLDTSTNGATNAQIVVEVKPNPVIATQNTGSLIVTATFDVAISEARGLGGELLFVSSTVFDPKTGAQLAMNYYDSADLVVFIGSKRVEGKGSLAVRQSLTYSLSDGSKEANLTVAVQFKDDRGNTLNRSAMATIK